jgi:hypothetical protein
MALARGQLSAEDRDRVERLIADDPEVRRLAGLLRALTDEADRDRSLKTAAKGLIGRLVKDFKKQERERPQRGVLTFDSGLLPLPAGIRPATIDSRRLKYRKGDISLEISLYPASPGTYEIIGQFVGFETGLELDVNLRSKAREFTDRTNPFQVFHFVRIPAGDYVLTLAGPDRQQLEFELTV